MATTAFNISVDDINSLLINIANKKLNADQNHVIEESLAAEYPSDIINEIISFSAFQLRKSKFCRCSEDDKPISGIFASNDGSVTIQCDCVFGDKLRWMNCDLCEKLSWIHTEVDRQYITCGCTRCIESDRNICEDCLTECEDPDCGSGTAFCTESTYIVYDGGCEKKYCSTCYEFARRCNPDSVSFK